MAGSAPIEYDELEESFCTYVKDKMYICGDSNRCTGAHIKLRGDNCSITGSHGILIGEHGSLTGSHGVVRGDSARVVGDSNDIEGHHCRVRGSRNTIRGNFCRIEGDNNTCTGRGTVVSSGTGNVVNGALVRPQPRVPEGFAAAPGALPPGPRPQPVINVMHVRVASARPRQRPADPLRLPDVTSGDEAEEPDERQQCPVCRTNPKRILLIGCGHSLCAPCVRQMGAGLTCPECRAPPRGFQRKFD